jgi:hypothetical protein
MTLVMKLVPEIPTPFGKQEAGLAAQLTFWAAEEAERGADRLIKENHAVRALLSEGLAFAGDARAEVQSAIATPLAPDYRISSLQAENDALRRGLVELHAAVERDSTPQAAAFNERIWAELVDSTRRRQFQARLG